MSHEDYDQQRKYMVEQQLAGRNIRSKVALEAMGRVPREEFVPPPYMPHAYEDRPLSIGHQQTISQPYMVAYMTQLLEIGSSDRVLEIGTGSGYQTAVLAELAARVYSLELFPELAGPAMARLTELGYENVEFADGNGYYGWPEAAPFDGILVACCAQRIPEPLIDQLKPGRRMVIPLGAEKGEQHLYCITRKSNGRLVQENLMPVRFVPMLSTHP